jgi:outer membrane protein assembly factor BamE (lipoprotein component of BamABCDE complex)
MRLPNRMSSVGRILGLGFFVSNARQLPIRMLAACALLGACSLVEPPSQVRGNKVDPEQLKELSPGTSTRADVTALIGSPTAHATFDDNTWIYIGALTRPRIGQTQAVLSQDVVVLTFTDQGVLRDIDRKSAADSLSVNVVERTTPSPGTEASFLQQLFGNIGRFNPAGAASSGLGGSANPTGGGAPKPY